MSLQISELFRSIQGESSYMGLPTAFVRLAGCNLRCRYCDTRHAWDEGPSMSVEEIVDQVLRYGLKLVEITGGEPLIQEETPRLASALLEKGCTVLVETNGTLDISVLPAGVIRIVDIKCPSSGEKEKTLWENIWKLTPDDEVKFVIANRHDYDWSKDIIRERFEIAGTKILLSAVFGELPPRNLVEWMLEDRLPARFQIQMHKIIWPHDMRGV